MEKRAKKGAHSKVMSDMRHRREMKERRDREAAGEGTEQQRFADDLVARMRRN